MDLREKLLSDLIYAASSLQNHPEKWAEGDLLDIRDSVKDIFNTAEYVEEKA